MAAEQPQDKYVVRLPDGMRDRLKEAAEQAKRTMNAEIIERIDAYETMARDQNWLRSEMLRLTKDRDDAWAQIRAVELRDINDTLSRILPEGLLRRIIAAAKSKDRPLIEEVVQTLEAAYPVMRRPTHRELLAFLEQAIADSPEVAGDSSQALYRDVKEAVERYPYLADLPFGSDGNDKP